jgi:Phytanoyl-CoA dioxygenase (PhyH)
MNRKVLNDEGLQQSFQEKGYVKLPLLDAQEVNSVIDFIKTLRPDDSFQPKGDSIYHRSTYHCSFFDTNVEYKKKVREFLGKIFQPHTDKILCGYEILNINFYVKQPGTGVFQIHQNWPSTPIEDTSVTVWCPLLDVAANNGGIQVVEGSHKIIPDIASLHAPIFFKQFEADLIRDFLKPIPMRAGEGLVFDDSLIHWSSENKSDKPRFAIQIEMLPNEVTPRYYHYDKTTNQFEVFAVDGEYYTSHNMSDLIERPKGIRSLGYLENKNRELSLEEFKIKMNDGPKTRKELYQS